MSTRATARSTSRRLVTGAIRSLILVVGIVGASVAAVLWLTESTRVARPGAVSRRGASPGAGSVRARSPVAPVPEPKIPLYTEDWTDDSGQGLALRFSRPIADPQSLERGPDVRRGARPARDRSTAGRAGRGRSSGPKAGRAQALQLQVFLGLLHMSIGEFVEADRRFAEAQAVDPDCPGLVRANIEALRGVAALRRGETENCVACCNGSSCIFPLAAAGRPPSPVRLARGDPPLHRPTSSSGPRTWASAGS